MAIYAPTSKKSEENARQDLWSQTTKICKKAPSNDILIIGGDMNAEPGAEKDTEFRSVLGPYGDKNRTATGLELIHFCADNKLKIAGTLFQQKVKHTWWHPRYESGHQLDHFLIRTRDRWNTIQCKTIHPTDTNNKTLPNRAWIDYTDHHPVELTMISAKDWYKEARKEKERERVPAYNRLWGTSEEAKRLQKELETN